MVAFNFQKQFAEDVESGRKRQTIRAKARAKVGDRLQLYTGQRTKACRKLGDAVCWSVVPVHLGRKNLTVNHTFIEGPAADCFAKADGFADYPEMAAWFAANGGLPFHGHLIAWELIG